MIDYLEKERQYKPILRDKIAKHPLQADWKLVQFYFNYLIDGWVWSCVRGELGVSGSITDEMLNDSDIDIVVDVIMWRCLGAFRYE